MALTATDLSMTTSELPGAAEVSAKLYTVGSHQLRQVKQT